MEEEKERGGIKMTKEDIQTMKSTVEDILANNIRARSDDKFLTLKVLVEMGFAELDLQNDIVKIDISQENMAEMPSFAGVKRIRAKLQNDQGLYLPPKRTRENRRMAEDQMNNINKWFDDREGIV